MNTPAHLIFGAAVFARPNAPAVNAAALFGALLPDLSLYLLAGWSLFVMAIPPETVFGELYFSPQWQGIFAVDNSIPLWALGLCIGLAMRSPVLIAFAGAGLLHLVFDLALHHDDARRHFWPITDYVFRSPISYWDPHHFGNIFGPLEIAVSLLLCALLWRRFKGWFARALIVAAALAELMPGLMFMVMFHG